MQPQNPEQSANEAPDFDALDKQEASQEVIDPLVPAKKAPKKDDDGEEDIFVKIASGTASKTDSAARQQTKTQTGQLLTPRIQEVGKNSGKSDHPTNQYVQVGALIDMWADLVEGYGAKSNDFWKHFSEAFKARNVKDIQMSLDNLQATGVIEPPYRQMVFIRRYPVTMTLYIATQGEDLYVSWRAFAQAAIAWWKIAVLAVVSGLFGIMVMNIIDFSNRLFSGGFNPPSPVGMGIAVFWGIVFFAAVGGWLCLQAYQKLDGDYLGFFREPLNELQADDVASLSAAVHKSVVYAFDKLGIDTTKLESREPFYKERKKRRF